jgi:putative tricarboxylic transport membrane protein
MADIFAGLMLVLDPEVLLVILAASFFGLFVGAVPGLTATMATALLIPVTFFMAPLPAVAAIVACTAMAITAGDIPGALLRIPGTPASAAYTDEAYALTRKGKPELALGVSLVCAAIGGLIGAVVLMLAAPLLARVALGFSSFEYFWLAALGLTSAAFVSTADKAKGVVSLTLGLFIATIGLDVTSGLPRFTLGSVELMGGVSFIPAMIGMFAVSEVLRNLTGGTALGTVPDIRVGNPFKGLGTVLWRYRLNILRGSALGTSVGALPGAGGDIAAWIAYANARRFSRTPEKFGTGHPEGIVEAGSANNSGLSSAWVPAMVFGIPGDAITAIAIGVLFMKGLNPGPRIFVDQPAMLYAIFITFFMANLLLIPLGWLAIRAARRILAVPRNLLLPLILVFCIVGSFAINNSTFGIGVMLALGLVAWLMEANGYPIAPVILGIVIGPLLEQSFMISMMIASGDPLAFFSRPIAAVLGTITVLVWAAPVGYWLARRLFGNSS